MHLMHFTPAVVLAFISVNAGSVIHNELRSEPVKYVSAYDAILESSPAALARDVNGKKIFLTKDNSCGKIGAGKNRGWYCDPKLANGGACCSSDGWCGNGPKYCEVGCQKEFGHCEKGVEKPVFKCGPKNKNKKCVNGECCSSNGFCGKNKNFCGVGCQDKFGKCEEKLKPRPDEKLCGPANKNQKCSKDQCCSHAGFCGIGVEFCAVPQNCLRGFGKCDSDVMPGGAGTIKDPRPQLGKIPYGKYITDCKQPGTIALTYDDGPNVYTNELLNKLKVAGAKATFVVAGNNNGRGQIDVGDKWPKLLKRMIAEGHQIASHSWSHPHFNAIKSEDRKMDMAKNERAIANVIGKYPTYMRPPYGECDNKSGCLRDLKEMGYSLLGQSLDTLDWKNAGEHIQDSDKLVKEYFDNLGPNGHALLCQHDTLAASVQELTPVILAKIKHKGFRAVTVGECLGDDMKNWYRIPGKGIRAPAVQGVDPYESEHKDTGYDIYNGDHCHEDSHDEKKRQRFPPFSPSPGPQETNSGNGMGWGRQAEPQNDTNTHDGADGPGEERKRQFFPLPPWLPPARRADSPVQDDNAASHSDAVSTDVTLASRIETDDEMEDDELEIARTKPTMPTFPNAADTHATGKRQTDDWCVVVRPDCSVAVVDCNKPEGFCLNIDDDRLPDGKLKTVPCSELLKPGHSLPRLHDPVQPNILGLSAPRCVTTSPDATTLHTRIEVWADDYCITLRPGGCIEVFDCCKPPSGECLQADSDWKPKAVNCSEVFKGCDSKIDPRDKEDIPADATEVTHNTAQATWDDIARTIMTPEEMSAEMHKEAHLSPEDHDDAETAKKQCVFTRGKFCGKIPHFVTQYGCFQSAKECYHQQLSCTTDKDAMKLDEKDHGKNGCWKWSEMCNEEVMFCLECGKNGAPHCNGKGFKPRKPKDIN